MLTDSTWQMLTDSTWTAMQYIVKWNILIQFWNSKLREITTILCHDSIRFSHCLFHGSSPTPYADLWERERLDTKNI